MEAAGAPGFPMHPTPAAPLPNYGEKHFNASPHLTLRWLCEVDAIIMPISPMKTLRLRLSDLSKITQPGGRIARAVLLTSTQEFC